jgi:uncharacterized protein (DUF58 family)
MPSGLATTPEGVLRRLEWRVIRRLDGRIQGDYRTMLRGAGIDVADLREYEPGDDVRHIDWNLTARMDTPHVRTYHEDRELTAWLLLDRSASMTFGPTERPKELVLTELATTLARLLIRGGNLVRPRSTRTHVLRLTHELLQPPAPRPPRATPEGRLRGRRRDKNRAPEPPVSSTDLTGLLTAAMHTIKRRSLVIIVSDFITEPGWERPLTMLSQRHEVVAIRIHDPSELQLPDTGLIVVEDTETGELLSVDTSDAEFRRRFNEAAAHREAAVLGAARGAGVDLHDVSTDDDLVDALVRIARHRRNRRR